MFLSDGGSSSADQYLSRPVKECLIKHGVRRIDLVSEQSHARTQGLYSAHDIAVLYFKIKQLLVLTKIVSYNLGYVLDEKLFLFIYNAAPVIFYILNMKNAGDCVTFRLPVYYTAVN